MKIMIDLLKVIWYSITNESRGCRETICLFYKSQLTNFIIEIKINFKYFSADTKIDANKVTWIIKFTSSWKIFW